MHPIILKGWNKQETSLIIRTTISTTGIIKPRTHAGLNPRWRKPNGEQMNHAEVMDKFGPNAYNLDLLEHIESIKNQYKYG